MVAYRNPGPLSEQQILLHGELRKARKEWYRKCRPGPLGCYSTEIDTDRQKSEPEYSVLQKFCVKGVGPDKLNRFDDLDDYIDFRNGFFGSSDQYWRFALASDVEFGKHIRLLSRTIPDPWKKRSWRRRVAGAHLWQRYLYRWLRKAYMNHGVTDVPRIVKSGKTPELKRALSRVKSSYGKSVRTGGFVPRPMKKQGGAFRLGTLSEHATGQAIDVESRSNPDLSVRVWRKLEAYTGQSINRSHRRWKDHPKALWQDVHDLNAEFIAKLEREANEDWQTKKEFADSFDQTPPPKELTKQAYKISKTKSLGLKERYHTGFFTLEWSLVDAFHDNDFRWGVTFGDTVDLHHFEL